MMREVGINALREVVLEMGCRSAETTLTFLSCLKRSDGVGNFRDRQRPHLQLNCYAFLTTPGVEVTA